MKVALSVACSLLFGVLLAGSSYAQPPVSTLSPNAKVSVLTCAPGTELYSVFGHSALRIQDSTSHLDWVWNYGVFEFDTPNFVMKFARGKLLYYVLSYSYKHFYQEYDQEGRSIYEQTLDLTEPQKRSIFGALLVNERPENRAYQYDFFYDNCATRERDILAKALGADLRFHPPSPDDFGTYRQLIDPYLRNQVWADFGIDLALGSPTDKTADQHGAMFLPDFLHKALETAEVRVGTEWRPLVSESKTLLSIPADTEVEFQYGPHLLGWGMFIVALLVTLLGFRTRRGLRGFDGLLFSVLGLLGIFLLLFWVATDHQATYWNLNLLWAVPLHLIFGVAVMFKRFLKFSLRYVRIMLSWSLGFLAVSWLLPQGFHAAFFPIMMAAALRLAWLRYFYQNA